MTLTQAARKANLKKWKAQGPAVIAKPLQAIHAHHPDVRDPNGALLREDPIYTEARRAANRGDGMSIKTLAQQLA